MDRPIVWVGAENVLPYDRPPLSKQILRGDWDAARTALKANYPMLGVEPRLGVRATALDTTNRRVTLSDSESIPYSGVVVATGASARNLRGGEHVPGVHVLRTLDDALAIRAALEKRPRVAVIGAGFIGLEVAAVARGLGLDVTVVEALETPLERSIGLTLGAAVAALHTSEGVTLRTGVGVERILGGNVERLLLADGTHVDADLVVVRIGVEPETAWLAGSSVRLERGVLCDSRCRSTAPDVVACGDVARWLDPSGKTMHVEHWTNAVEQANAAVAALDGDAAPEYSPRCRISGPISTTLSSSSPARSNPPTRSASSAVRWRRDLVATWGRSGKLTAVLTVNNPAVFIETRRAIQQGAAFDAGLLS